MAEAPPSRLYMADTALHSREVFTCLKQQWEKAPLGDGRWVFNSWGCCGMQPQEQLKDKLHVTRLPSGFSLCCCFCPDGCNCFCTMCCAALCCYTIIGIPLSCFLFNNYTEMWGRLVLKHFGYRVMGDHFVKVEENGNLMRVRVTRSGGCGCCPNAEFGIEEYEPFQPLQVVVVGSSSSSIAVDMLQQEFQRLAMSLTSLAESDQANDQRKATEDLAEQIQRQREDAARLEKELSQLKNSPGASLDVIEQKVKMFEASQAALLALHTEKVEIENIRGLFQDVPQVWVFYRACNIKLEEIFIGIKAVASGVASNNLEGTLGKVARGCHLLGQFLSFVPTFGETLSAMANVGGQVAGSIDKMRMDNMVKTISRLGRLGT